MKTEGVGIRKRKVQDGKGRIEKARPAEEIAAGRAACWLFFKKFGFSH